MPYVMPSAVEPSKTPPQTALLVASGDLRASANIGCWPAQQSMEARAEEAFRRFGWTLRRVHGEKSVYDAAGRLLGRHGFVSSQKEGMDLFATLDPDAPLVVAEAVWQYSHHVLSGLAKHRGSILTLANWSGTWPGLVGVLNLNASMTKQGIRYSCLWGEDFASQSFLTKLEEWLKTGIITHDTSHVRPFCLEQVHGAEAELAKALATQLSTQRAIMGVFDEGCMGMFNAIIPDHLLHPTGVFKERLSQSALYAEMLQTSDQEAHEVRRWLDDNGMRFLTGPDEASDLTDSQIHDQCKMYIAALRIADDFGCDCIGIQYQQGLRDLAPASDLAEGLLNNSDRPPVRSRDGRRVLWQGKPLPHFNEVDECSGLDAILTNRVWTSMNLPPETTLHDVRWGDLDSSRTTDEYVWVWLISGSAPPAHFIDGFRGASSERQPPMYFRLGGGTLKGISKPGEVVWSRIYVMNEALHMDIGRCKVVKLPTVETQRRWNETTPCWPIMHAVTYGVTRDQMMAQHKSNHLNVAYAADALGRADTPEAAEAADRAAAAKAALAALIGIQVHVCGTNHAGLPLCQAMEITTKRPAR